MERTREKRTEPTTVHLTPTARMVAEHLSAHERRSLSTVIAQVFERDPVVQVLIQKIGGERGNG